MQQAGALFLYASARSACQGVDSVGPISDTTSAGDDDIVVAQRGSMYVHWGRTDRKSVRGRLRGHVPMRICQLSH